MDLILKVRVLNDIKHLLATFLRKAAERNVMKFNYYVLFANIFLLVQSNLVLAHPGHSHGKKSSSAKPVRSSINTKKTASGEGFSLLDNSYGLFKFGHFNGTYFHPNQKNHIDSSDVKLSAGLTIGSTFYDEKFDLSLTLNHELDDDTTNVQSSQPAIVADLKLIEGSFGGISASLTYEPEMGDKGSQGTPTLTYSLPTFENDGFSLFSSVSVGATVPGHKKKMTAEVIYDDPAFDGETVQITQRDLEYDTTASIGANYKLGFIRGLTLKSQASFTTGYKPVYKVKRDDFEQIHLAETDIVATKSSEGKLGFGYQISNRMELTSDLVLRSEGFFDKPHSGYEEERFTHLTALIVNLF